MSKYHISSIVPITDDEEILSFIHALNGDRKHDYEVGSKYGMPHSVTDVIRRVFGKVPHKHELVPEDIKQKIIAEYNEGTAIKLIAKEVGMKVGSVYSVLYYSGIERNRHSKWSKIAKMRLVDLRDRKKMTWAAIAAYFEKSSDACHLQYSYIKGIQPRQLRAKKIKEGKEDESLPNAKN